MRNRRIALQLRFALATVAALAFVAVAAAGPSVSQVNVTLLDGKVVVAPRSVTAGPVTLVVVNKGSETHALAIFGAGKLKRTPTLKPEGTTKLTLDTRSGTYRVWDPVRSSLSHASLMMVKAPASSSAGSTSSGGTAGGSSLSNSGTTTCLPGQNSDMYDASNDKCPPGMTP
jgi:plastocyanin